MIFIRELGENIVKIPKNGTNFNEKHITLKIKSNMLQKEYLFDDLTDNDNDSNFYNVIIDFENVEMGEYEYLLDDGEWQSRGLIRVGTLKNDIENKSYENIDEVTEYRYGE